MGSTCTFKTFPEKGIIINAYIYVLWTFYYYTHAWLVSKYLFSTRGQPTFITLHTYVQQIGHGVLDPFLSSFCQLRLYDNSMTTPRHWNSNNSLNNIALTSTVATCFPAQETNGLQIIKISNMLLLQPKHLIW